MRVYIVRVICTVSCVGGILGESANNLIRSCKCDVSIRIYFAKNIDYSNAQPLEALPIAPRRILSFQ